MSKNKKDQAIQKVSRLTGLNPHVIRVWERRYGAVAPERTQTNRRVYTQDDIERLQLLGYLTREGRRIGQVARLSLVELKELVENLEKEKGLEDKPAGSASDLMKSCLYAISRLNARELDISLAKATVFMSPVVIIQNLIIPLLDEVAQQMRLGKLRLVHERFAYAGLRPFLANFMKSYEAAADGPKLVSTTLLGQTQEFGALYVLSAAAATGWRATYLGPNLPAEEIAAAVHQLNADAVALAFHQPRNDPRVFGELENLRRLLPEAVRILGIGAALGAYQQGLEKIGAVAIPDFSQMSSRLETLRNSLHP